MIAASAKSDNKALPRVLCVDDEPEVLEGLAVQLRRIAEVVPANSGAEALELMRSSGPFAGLVSDMRLPHMNGIVLGARASRRERGPGHRRPRLPRRFLLPTLPEPVPSRMMRHREGDSDWS